MFEVELVLGHMLRFFLGIGEQCLLETGLKLKQGILHNNTLGVQCVGER